MLATLDGAELVQCADSVLPGYAEGRWGAAQPIGVWRLRHHHMMVGWCVLPDDSGIWVVYVRIN